MAYDAQHRRDRAAMLPGSLGRRCRRCGLPMLPGQELDAGHPDDSPLAVNRASRADAIEHASCNRSAGGRLGNERRNLQPSRDW